MYCCGKQYFSHNQINWCSQKMCVFFLVVNNVIIFHLSSGIFLVGCFFFGLWRFFQMVVNNNINNHRK